MLLSIVTHSLIQGVCRADAHVSKVVITLRRLTWISRAISCTMCTCNHHALEPWMKKFMHNNVKGCLHVNMNIDTFLSWFVLLKNGCIMQFAINEVGISFAHASVRGHSTLEINKPSHLLRSRGKNTSFVVLAQECFCLSRMTSEISHGSLLTARFWTRLFSVVVLCIWWIHTS